MICGRWARNADGDLQSDPADTAGLRPPFKVSGEYDLRVRFTRVAGDHGIYLLLAFDGHQFSWAMNNSADRGRQSACGFERLGGRSFLDPQNPSTVYLDDPTPVGRASVVVARVRKAGVMILLDGNQICAIKTDYRDLERFGDCYPAPGFGRSSTISTGAISLNDYGKIDP